MSMTKPAPIRTKELTPTTTPAAAPDPLSVHTLTNEHRQEVLAFLAERPLQTVIMAGHIRDNGLESKFNRGHFHACRNGEGHLEGVALIGHATLVEARSEAALAAFARLAQSCPDAHLIMGEQERIEHFWHYYAKPDQSPRRICRELLLEQRWPVEALEPVPNLRLASLAELQEVMIIQDEMAFQESGVNPMKVDLSGFSSRCSRRIEQGRVWVWMEDGRLIFKADVISDTPEIIYLEGIYVNPEVRGQGYGARCMSQLARVLLQRTDALSILVNEQSQRAVAFFDRIGFKLRGYYDTIFLEQRRAG